MGKDVNKPETAQGDATERPIKSSRREAKVQIELKPSSQTDDPKALSALLNFLRQSVKHCHAETEVKSDSRPFDKSDMSISVRNRVESQASAAGVKLTLAAKAYLARFGSSTRSWLEGLILGGTAWKAGPLDDRSIDVMLRATQLSDDGMLHKYDISRYLGAPSWSYVLSVGNRLDIDSELEKADSDDRRREELKPVSN